MANLSTEHYIKAEIIQPVRYSYTTLTNSLLEKTLLVEKNDEGRAKRHEFLWLDWKNKETLLFEIDDKNTQEKVINNIPDFFNDFSLSESQRKHLVYKESGDKISQMKVLDPLSLIYYLRTKNSVQKNEIFIAVSDDIRKYKIEFVGKEVLEFNAKKIPIK